MAINFQAQLLDELMGRNRNAGPGLSMKSTRFDDKEVREFSWFICFFVVCGSVDSFIDVLAKVCKFALVDFCPHDLFVNTRADLGPCDKIHDDELKSQYKKSSRFGKLGYEEDFEHFIRGLLSDVERKIKRGVERLKLTQNDIQNQVKLICCCLKWIHRKRSNKSESDHIFSKLDP